jgi:AraC-like DNA-binding protein
VPDGCVDVVWIDHGAILVCGPETAGWTFHMPADTSAVGVRLRPGQAPAVFGVDANHLLDRRLALDDLLGTAVQRRTIERLAAAPDDAARVVVLERSIARWAATNRPADPLASAVTHELGRRHRPRVEQLANMIGITPRQLHRRCTRSFGYGPSTLARFVRLQRFLTLAARERPRPTIAALAADAGYADHAHLVRECRTIAGATPTELLDEYVPTFPNESDPYKTVVPAWRDDRVS